MIAANASVTALLAGVADAALLAPHIANLPEWRAHLLERLRRQVEAF